MAGTFETNVFINCPYDAAFMRLLRPLVFTVIFAGLTPRLSLEQMDSGEARIQKIARLISESKYAIHDISRMQADGAGETFRLNMPFELGLDIGCRLFAEDVRSEKRCLILERERYRFQAAISDLSNSDIGAHGDVPEEVVAVVRDWLNCEAGCELPGPSRVWGAFLEFIADDFAALKAKKYTKRDIERLPLVELMTHMRTWVAVHNT